MPGGITGLAVGFTTRSRHNCRGVKQKGIYMFRSHWLLLLAAVMSQTVAAQSSDLLGRHTINLRLKPMPAAQVLDILSARSRATAQLKDAPSDEGRPWSVEGAALLEGVMVKVEIVETPLHEVVSRLLGCVGFAYEERGDRIRITAADTWPKDRCSGIERVATQSEQTTAVHDPNKTYSWSYASISAFDFVSRWATDTARGVVVPNRENEELRSLMLKVELKNVRAPAALEALARCIGYVVESRGDGFIVTTSKQAQPARCEGFEFLGGFPTP